jgi:hypothetical protein
MSLLIMHRGKLSATPYHDWLAPCDEELLLLLSAEELEGEAPPAAGGAYRHVEVIENWDAGGEPDLRAIEVAAAFPVTRLIARHERDLLRAAAIRDVLGLPGTDPRSAVAFRDKAIMKGYARRAGIGVADFQPVECNADALSFAARNGFPVVLKPRTGAGSKDNWIVESMEQLIDVLDGPLARYRSHQPNLLVEAFVPGPMYHVDGLAQDGKLVVAWPSRYLDPLSSYRDKPIRLDVMLAAEDPMTGRLLDFAERLMSALPSPPICAFHAEVFHRPGDEIVLCEVACRTGGARIRDIMRVAFGVDLTAVDVRAQAGLPLPDPVERLPHPRVFAGQMLIMKRAGRAVAVPAALPFDGVERFDVTVRPGELVREPAFSGDVAASAVVSGPTRAVVQQRLGDIRTWIDHNLVIRPEP